jgi:sialic acid synthase SpsE
MNENELIIISEIGINHKGKLDNIFEMIRQSKLGGANLIKLQLYSSLSLFGNFTREKYELKLENLELIDKFCKGYNIEWFASVFDEKHLKWCENFNIQKYKIASRTYAYDKDLCDKIIETEKIVFISLGMEKEIDQYYLSLNNPKIYFFNCLSKYPSTILDLKEEYKYCFDFQGQICGFSDHFIGISKSLYAISQGAKIIEKHFTLNKFDNDSRDHLGSMDLNDLKILNEYGRELFFIHSQKN